MEELESKNISTTQTQSTQPEILNATKTQQINQVTYILKSIRAGAADRGGFTMGDVTSILKSNDRLICLFTSDDNGKFSCSKSEDYDALEVLLKSIQILHATGVFDFESGAKLLEIFESLKKSLDDCKDPSLKIAAMRKDLADTKQSHTHTQQRPRGGKGRGKSTANNNGF